MKTVVGVLRGGPSSEYEVSLKSGANVLAAIDQNKYSPIDIFIDREGHWHLHGREVQPEHALSGVDVALNILHGEYGEGGDVQNILEATGTPYSGSDAFASKIAFNKHATKELLSKQGFRLARHRLLEQDDVVDTEQVALELFRTFPHPAIVKPAIGGSSVGITLANSFHSLHDGIEKAFTMSPQVLVEEFIPGVEATVGVVEGFRGEPLFALPPVEIVPPPQHTFFNYDAKYGGESTERVPGNFTPQVTEQLMLAAKHAHEALGAAHYTRSDFIVSKRGIYFLELNSAAAVGMTAESLFPKAVVAAGSHMGEFLDHIIALALGAHKR